MESNRSTRRPKYKKQERDWIDLPHPACLCALPFPHGSFPSFDELQRLTFHQATLRPSRQFRRAN